eukprot:TRINITY_DN21460_c0_g1_i1.p1 TRINITY_DN21460_c0_g1~~TRINITY_DN21460_c0_g1_i1.p1  ORF type:complete len:191 (-),score=54.02 TRINITY_DN21460_c0_g1_i1:4-576(-)
MMKAIIQNNEIAIEELQVTKSQLEVAQREYETSKEVATTTINSFNNIMKENYFLKSTLAAGQAVSIVKENLVLIFNQQCKTNYESWQEFVMSGNPLLDSFFDALNHLNPPLRPSDQIVKRLVEQRVSVAHPSVEPNDAERLRAFLPALLPGISSKEQKPVKHLLVWFERGRTALSSEILTAGFDPDARVV